MLVYGMNQLCLLMLDICINIWMFLLLLFEFEFELYEIGSPAANMLYYYI